MAYYMDSVNVIPDRYTRPVVVPGQKPDGVSVTFFQPQPMKRAADDSVVNAVQKQDAVNYYAPPSQVKRVDDTLEGVVVADPNGTELCAAPTAGDVPESVQAVAVAAATTTDSVAIATPGVSPGVVPPQVQKQKLTVGATQLTMEQKITFARLAIAWKGQGRPMREFDTLMKSAGYQVSPSSLAQWMKLPDATGVVPPPRKRKDRDSSKRKFVRTWMPKI